MRAKKTEVESAVSAKAAQKLEATSVKKVAAAGTKV